MLRMKRIDVAKLKRAKESRLSFAKIPSALKGLTFQAPETDSPGHHVDSSSASFVGFYCVSVPFQSGPRKPRPSAAARDPEATVSTTEASKVGSNLLAAFVASLVTMEGDVGHRETRNRRSLAAEEIRIVLDPPVAEESSRSAREGSRNPGPDSQDRKCQRTVGRAAGARRTSETRN